MVQVCVFSFASLLIMVIICLLAGLFVLVGLISQKTKMHLSKSLMPMHDEGEGLEVPVYTDVDGWGCDSSRFTDIATSVLVMLQILDTARVFKH